MTTSNHRERPPVSMPPDPLGIQIGAREIYDKLTDVDRKVGALGGQLDRLADQHDGLRLDVVEVRADITDHETRLRAIERDSVTRTEVAATKSRTLQAVAAIVAAGGVIAGIVMPIIVK